MSKLKLVWRICSNALSDLTITQCDGVRPTCQKCLDTLSTCSYSADADATPIIALKRKFIALEQDHMRDKRRLDLISSLLASPLVQDDHGGPHDSISTRNCCASMDLLKSLASLTQDSIDEAPDQSTSEVDDTTESPDTCSSPSDMPSTHDQQDQSTLTSPTLITTRSSCHARNHAAFLVQILASATDFDSAGLLARIRGGENWKELVRSFTLESNGSEDAAR